MRIGSGEMRGRRLRAPSGDRTRPTSGRLKKSLFDVLAARLRQARVLDLYAGSGALAFEALSRGAAAAVLVERNRKACDFIRRNLRELRLTGRADVVPGDVLPALSKLAARGERFDVVFADPPYRFDPEKLLRLLGEEPLLEEGGLLALEHHHKRELRERYGKLLRKRVLKAGESSITLYESLSGSGA